MSAAGNTALAAVAPPQPAAAPPAVALPPAADSVSVGALRAGLTLLVLAHHAAIAYHPDAPPAPASLLTQPRWWGAFPVVDPARWAPVRLFAGFNDTFFMALLFLVSGLFVWKGLERSGSAAFLRRRAMRLGIPFLVATALVAPLAYYPAYLQTGAGGGLSGFARQWLALGNWPAGPAWFLWVLLAFDCLAALLFARFPTWGQALARRTAGIRRRPAACCALLVAVSAVAYVPMLLTFGPLAWASWGPFFVQTSRIFLYAVYFTAGIAIGAGAASAASLGHQPVAAAGAAGLATASLETGLLAADGPLARRWLRWLLAAAGAFVALIVATVLTLAPHASPRAWGALWGTAFVLSCACTSFAGLALAVRFFARRRSRALASLRANAYGMYVLHYPAASWLQFALLPAALPAAAKCSIAIAGTVAMAWGATALLRRIPAVARVI